MPTATPTTQPPTPPFASWNPSRGCWETSQLDLFGRSAPYWAIWPTSGWMRAGSAYRHHWPVHRITGSASSSPPIAKTLFRTPLASDSSRGGETLDQVRARRGNDRAESPGHRPGPARTGWLTEQIERIGDTVRPRGGHLRRWGRYAHAIARWEHITGRPAPAPAILNEDRWENAVDVSDDAAGRGDGTPTARDRPDDRTGRQEGRVALSQPGHCGVPRVRRDHPEQIPGRAIRRP